MKKFILKTAVIALSSLFAFNVMAAEPKLGKDYVAVAKAQPDQQKEVVEFFSFYCPHCYDFQYKYKIPEQIDAKLPEGTKVVQYHVDFMGGVSKELTNAWALAMALGAEDKVREPLFDAARANKLKSMNDIRQVFIDNGVSEKEFDDGIKSFAVIGLANKQRQATDELKVMGVPAFFVDGKYQINNDGFNDVKSTEEFITRYVDIVAYLAKK